jgi:hypothetical protein
LQLRQGCAEIYTVAEAERAGKVVAARRADEAKAQSSVAAWIARGFSRVEDVVYVGLALMLAVTAVVMLGHGLVDLWRSIAAGDLSDTVVLFLDRILLILMIVEILYTVQVSLRERALVPEPFLVVGLIAGIRRILVLTAEFSEMIAEDGDLFRNAMLELGLLTIMVLTLVIALVLLRRRAAPAAAPKSA